jgi:hypothetical protein
LEDNDRLLSHFTWFLIPRSLLFIFLLHFLLSVDLRCLSHCMIRFD